MSRSSHTKVSILPPTPPRIHILSTKTRTLTTPSAPLRPLLQMRPLLPHLHLHRLLPNPLHPRQPHRPHQQRRRRPRQDHPREHRERHQPDLQSQRFRTLLPRPTSPPRHDCKEPRHDRHSRQSSRLRLCPLNGRLRRIESVSRHIPRGSSRRACYALQSAQSAHRADVPGLYANRFIRRLR
jgi:hypothetical protein